MLCRLVLCRLVLISCQNVKLSGVGIFFLINGRGESKILNGGWGLGVWGEK